MQVFDEVGSEEQNLVQGYVPSTVKVMTPASTHNYRLSACTSSTMDIQQEYLKPFVMRPTEEYNSLALVTDAKNRRLDLPRPIRADVPIPNSACRFFMAVTHNDNPNAPFLFQCMCMIQARTKVMTTASSICARGVPLLLSELAAQIDIAHGPPMLDNAHIRFLVCLVHRDLGCALDPVLYGSGDGRDHLNRFSEVRPFPL